MLWEMLTFMLVAALVLVATGLFSMLRKQELPKLQATKTSRILLGKPVVGRQFFRVRRDEARLIELEKSDTASSRQASDLYELGSVQLRKRLYPQAAATLKQALKRLSGEPDEARALIENALGFALAAQKDYSGATKHYKLALKAKADYPVALNNLAFAQEKLLKDAEAISLYEQTLQLEPDNATAKKGLKKLKRRNS